MALNNFMKGEVKWSTKNRVILSCFMFFTVIILILRIMFDVLRETEKESVSKPVRPRNKLDVNVIYKEIEDENSLEQEICGICRNSYKALAVNAEDIVARMPCGHQMHYMCLNGLKNSNIEQNTVSERGCIKCPYCRNECIDIYNFPRSLEFVVYGTKNQKKKFLKTL